jgi:hypothetical protein
MVAAQNRGEANPADAPTPETVEKAPAEPILEPALPTEALSKPSQS